MPPQRLSLAQQITELDDPTPVDFDPEDEHLDSHEQLGDKVEAREHYVNVSPSALRRNLDRVTDPKYHGTKTSRKQLEEENASFTDSPEPVDPASQNSSSEGSFGEEDGRGKDAPSPGKEEASGDDEQSTLQHIRGDQEDTSHEKDPSTTLRQRRDDDRKKGKAVIRQLNLQDSLLDARIHLQKSATAFSRLPSIIEMSDFTSHPLCLEARHALLGETLALVEELSTLRDSNGRPRKRRRVQDDSEQGRRYLRPQIDPVDQGWDTLIREASEDAVGLEHAYHPHLTRTLEKWSAKVAAVAPSALHPASRKRFSVAGSMKEGVKSVGTQIEDMLCSEWPVLLSRTRLKRSKGPRVTDEGGEVVEEDEEVFDDTDFYQQLLRDVIDSKGGGPGQVMDWTANQKRKKAKKIVDTRASKGRKLRYEVHEKIQNFMVPVPLGAGAWHEAQIDELFASLLGKGFKAAEDEDEDISLAGGAVISADADVGVDVLLRGFRVFGD
ncbi:apoptosis-antagonizing transcription factor [Russula earlei]|uniref:Apoptosis-antagonizing transcription factor n=1 Tax=Russula earlei TaxID=71964 RepID=A0ACC0UIN6_9AGAM|nr:apoptosis-antagonizing transcription factor [Russula earlei]